MASKISDRLVFFPSYSDGKILLYVLKWKGWAELQKCFTYKNHNFFTFFIIVFKDSFIWLSELLAMSIRLITRRSFGKQSVGLVLIFSIFWLQILIGHTPGFRSYLDFFGSLWMAVFGLTSNYSADWEEIGQNLFNPRSIPLLLHTALFLMGALYNLICIYAGKKYRDAENPQSKGTSWFYLAFRSRTKLGKEFFHILFEPSLCLLFGIAMMQVFHDSVYGIFLIICGSALFTQEYLDYRVKKLHET